jgi:hypothetical protein
MRAYHVPFGGALFFFATSPKCFGYMFSVVAVTTVLFSMVAVKLIFYFIDG